jgi:polyphosphate kinase
MNKPFIERDISWLSFNERVLQEAKDKTVPLYERLKFLAIYSSNLDEFFRVRVASLRSFRKLEKATRKEMQLKPRRLLKEIRKIVQAQQAEFGHIFREEILPELARNRILLVHEGQFGADQMAFAQLFFLEKIAPALQILPLSLDDPPFLENKSVYLVACFSEATEQPVLLRLPSEQLGRFVVLPSQGNGRYIAFLDDLVRVGLPSLFPGREITGVYAIKLSRDAELNIDDEYSGDLVDKIRKGLEDRHIGLPTRFLYDASMPEALLSRLKEDLELSKNDLIPGARYHNFNDFFGFPDPDNLQELHDAPMLPLPHPAFEKSTSMFEKMREKDQVLHLPYQQFGYVERFIGEAAADSAVEHLKITLYRVASKSSVCEGLLKALQNGKKVTAFIEAKARFDEESNLLWGERLQAAGATVRYSFPGIKVHSKLLLVTRREAGGSRNYAYLSTGNFNEKTAQLYSDHGIFTADKRLADEAAQVFDLLEGKILLLKCKHLLVAPHHLRNGFEHLINREIANARNGKTARIILKINSLEDQRMMEKLIEASQAGVKIRLIVRGICCLSPGIAGQTDNIEIISILDRFLEHARIYIFSNDGNEKIFLSSADWMGRNLDRRVEVAFPVYDPDIAAQIRQIIGFQLHDNTKARIIDAEHKNRYVKKSHNKEIRAQKETYLMLAQEIL